MKPKFYFQYILLAFLAIVLCISACSSPSNPISPTATVSQPATNTIMTQTTLGAPSTATSQPATAEPTATASLEKVLPLEFIDQGFAVSSGSVYYGFLVHNPNATYAIQNSSFMTTFYNAAGEVLGEDGPGLIGLVLPNQTLGMSSGRWLENAEVASINIELTSGEPLVLTENLPTYEVTNSSVCVSPYTVMVRAEIFNPNATIIYWPWISTIFYNADGKIVGSTGGTRIGFLPNSKTGIISWGYCTEDMDHYEIYPSYSVPSTTPEIPADAQPLKVVDSGYAVSGSTLTYAVIIENPNPAYMVDQSLLSVNAYDANGKFLSGQPFLVLNVQPGQKLGISSNELELCSEDVVDHIEVAIGSGQFISTQPVTYFTSENVTLQGSKVLGELVNQSGKKIKAFFATAIVYDADGKVIGGGKKTIDAVEADTRVSVEINVAINGTPAYSELYAVLTPKSLKK